MTVYVSKRARCWWYDFQYLGQRYNGSTHQESETKRGALKKRSAPNSDSNQEA